MNATVVRGVVRNGRIEIAGPIDFPEGTEVTIKESRLVDEDDGPMSPEEIARVLAAMEKIEPFALTPEEEAEWEAERKARKESEKALFMENAERLRRMWDERYLLDSGILSAYINRRQGVYERGQNEVKQGNVLGTGLPVLAELAAGIENSSSRERNMRSLRSVLPTLRLWPLDQDASFEYGRLHVELLRMGRPMQVIDIMIAAIARVLGKCVVVSMDSDLSAVPGITVENWAE